MRTLEDKISEIITAVKYMSQGYKVPDDMIEIATKQIMGLIEKDNPYNEIIYKENGRVCIERRGGRMWFNINTLNNLIEFHKKELKSLYEAKRHLTQQSDESRR